MKQILKKPHGHIALSLNTISVLSLPKMADPRFTNAEAAIKVDEKPIHFLPSNFLYYKKKMK